jgi:ABC-type multidrug transport system fused ATPase/permease subunit
MESNNKKKGSEFLKIMKGKAKDGTLKAVWKDWLWIWSFSRRRWGAVVLYTMCGIGSSGLALVSSVISKYMIDAIVSLELNRLLMYCISLLLSAAAAMAFQSFTARFATKLNIGMQNDVQAKVFDDILGSDWMALSKYPSGDLLSRFSSDVGTVAGCAVSWLPNVLIQLFTVLATLCVILYYDPIMALIGCASTPVLFLMSRRLLTRQREHTHKLRQVSGDMAAFQDAADESIIVEAEDVAAEETAEEIIEEIPVDEPTREFKPVSLRNLQETVQDEEEDDLFDIDEDDDEDFDDEDFDGEDLGDEE